MRLRNGILGIGSFVFLSALFVGDAEAGLTGGIASAPTKAGALLDMTGRGC
jgi:hypothetical protein